MIPGPTVNLSLRRALLLALLGLILIGAATPAPADPPVIDSVGAVLSSPIRFEIARQVPGPSVIFARHSGSDGGGSGRSSGSDDKGKGKEKKDKKEKQSRSKQEKKGEERSKGDRKEKKKGSEKEVTQEKKDRNKKEEGKDGNNQGSRKDKKEEKDGKEKKDKGDKKDKRAHSEDRSNENHDDDDSESRRDSHDHDGNERHDHRNEDAEARHDHGTEEHRHDHHERGGHAESEDAEPQEHEQRDGGASDADSADSDPDPTNESAPVETRGQELSEGEPAALLEISGTPQGTVFAGNPYAFSPTVEYSGQSILVFSIAGLPGWARFDDLTGELSGTPRESDVGLYEAISISVTDGSTETSLQPFSIAVGSATGSVTLSWMPPTENEDGSLLVDLAGYRIYWRKTNWDRRESMKLEDPELSTIVIDNLESGTYEFAMTSYNAAGIESELSNTFTRIVDANSEAGGNTADAEVPDTSSGVPEDTAPEPFLMLSGIPPEAVTAGDLYLFTPGFDSSGESPPTFMIDGLPHWAGFTEATGELYGSPSEADVGFYDAITISATDGVVETSLPTFSIEVVASGAAQGAVTLSWMPPAENEDGTYLVDLAGYWIYWGNNAGTYTEWMRIDDPGLTTVVIVDLVPGTWEFAMTSFNADGVESKLSNAVTRFVE